MLVGQDGRWNVIHVLRYGWFVVILGEVVVQVLASRDLGLEFGKVRRYVIGLFSNGLTIRNVFADRWWEVVDLRRRQKKLLSFCVHLTL